MIGLRLAGILCLLLSRGAGCCQTGVWLQSDCALCRVREAISEQVFSTLMTSTPTAFSTCTFLRISRCSPFLQTGTLPTLLRLLLYLDGSLDTTPLAVFCTRSQPSSPSLPVRLALRDLSLICTIAFVTLCFSRSRPGLPAPLCAAPPQSSWTPWHNFHPTCSATTVTSSATSRTRCLICMSMRCMGVNSRLTCVFWSPSVRSCTSTLS